MLPSPVVSVSTKLDARHLPAPVGSSRRAPNVQPPLGNCSRAAAATLVGVMSAGSAHVRRGHHHRRTITGMHARGGQSEKTGGNVALDDQLSEFQDQLVQAWDGFHVHVGAGKIGLGLVLPSIVRRGRNFALLQRPTEKWRALLGEDFVTVSVNGKHITKLRIVSTLEQLNEATANALGELQSSRSHLGEVIDLDKDIFNEGILVISSDPAMIRALVDKAASFSIAVGGRYMKQAVQPIINALEKKNKEFFQAAGPNSLADVKDSVAHGDLVHAIEIAASAAAGAAQAAGTALDTAAAVARSAGLKPPRSKLLPPPPLYCCENDHDAVHDLEDWLGGKMSVVPVLVDRVCSDIEFNGTTIEVGTEKYVGDMVFPPGMGGSMPLPFAGANVHEPVTELGSQFLHQKKLLTVNGTHTTLAFLTLLQAEPDTEGPPKDSHELLTYDADEGMNSGDVDSVARDLFVWSIARQVQLLSEYHEEVAVHTMKKSSTFGKTKWAPIASKQGDRQALVQSLLNNAAIALRRLSIGGDETGRVLGGGVDNRFKTRLANVLEFLRENEIKDLPPVAQELLATAGVSEAELRSRVERVVRDASRFVSDPGPIASKDTTRWGLTPRKETVARKAAQTDTPKASSVSVLFDFDGTLGDTESPAMEVAYWTIAPYLPSLTGASIPKLLQACGPYVRDNAGKAFEHMMEVCDEERKAAGLPSIEETRAEQLEDESMLSMIDMERDTLGLPRISTMREEGTEPTTLLEQQKLDTVTRLSIAARACPGVKEALGALESMGVPFVIATTSGKPRVPVCVDAAGLRHMFPSDDDSIHSGESDFDPPRFKPEPDVYLKAADSVERNPADCVAVEDSASGVGSAANAGIGFIVGYVGGSHIDSELKESHARMLMEGSRSKDGRGADVVISHMFDLPLVVQHFQQCRDQGAPLLKPSAADFVGAAGRVYVHGG
eukprot:gb/GFBE01081143.1/.p1 GENE.gb/GFBE01081143.1/~~gb/GFBE01081143.1/.p1  ORF type:complete len:950 (+),score=198.27 gb/GFBE01081143.1/:1-2850(+)